MIESPIAKTPEIGLTTGNNSETVFTEADDVSAQALSTIKRAEVMKQHKLTFIDKEGDPVEFFQQAAGAILNGEEVKVKTDFFPQILVVDEIYGEYNHTFYAFKENGDPILQGEEFNRFCTNSRLSPSCNVGLGASNSDPEKVDVYNYDGDFMSTLKYSNSDFDSSIIETVQEIVTPHKRGENSAENFIKLYDELSELEESNDEKLQNLDERQREKIDTFKKLMGPLKKHVEELEILHETAKTRREEA